MITSVISAIIVLGILVFIHELGHFLAAKRLGVGVLTFSLGFGPKLIGRRIGETQYQIAAVPVGGFVKLMGENPGEEINERDRTRAFSAQPVWKRAFIVGAGPVFNLFFAAFLFSTINLFGIPFLPAKVGTINPDLPAERAGLQKGDVILAIDGESLTTWDELSKIIRNSQGKELRITLKRNDEKIQVEVTPQASKTKNLFGEEVNIYLIGITPAEEVMIRRVGPLAALGRGIAQTWQWIELTIVTLVKLIGRVIPAKTIGGPILIAQLAGEQAKRGLVSFVLYMAILSINLGVINLFPIPILDGGHFLFLGLEAFLRRPISIKKMEIAQQIGLVFIIALMIFAFYNDLIRIFSPGGLKF